MQEFFATCFSLLKEGGEGSPFFLSFLPDEGPHFICLGRPYSKSDVEMNSVNHQTVAMPLPPMMMSEPRSWRPIKANQNARVARG